LHYLDAIYQLLNTYLKPSFRLLITVSPVPLSFTFRVQDILVANTYSKAVLRAALEEFLLNKANVNYFPSYEFVTLSNPAVVWSEHDFRHVDSLFIDYIMANVMQQFTDKPLAQQTTELIKAKALYNKNFINEAKTIVSALVKQQGFKNKELTLLSTALRLGISNKQSLLFKLLEHFKTYRHLSPREQINDLIRGYRKNYNRRFMGYIDSWQNSQVTGWAVNIKKSQSIKLNIMVNNELVKTVIADQPRDDVVTVYGCYLYCGFSIELELNKAVANKIQIVFADSGQELSGSPIYQD
jgi:hypothetical protein